MSLKDGKQDRSYGNISDKQYLHLQNVWNIFNFINFEDFNNHCLKKDLLLLLLLSHAFEILLV